ncbi:MAG: ankyrin repeat domain-containing protein [Pseudobutyrivibrio sp.]|uniref:ankyrin repeat domain-containing protein n=1 Tax=Pseudobutyrivibrio sp. TaxID=2014367 RepID=UPI0025DAF297|nr:ankyrin repeat domain-containing protein [Pseudobutyrivibrio sp.]MBQ8488246.1 ankyrin repeat domain-containing protein [Pseudobutyrivibrio sp.]
MDNKESIKKMRQLIKQGNIQSVKKLIKKNKELLTIETPFGTWLEVSADLGQIDLVKFFLESGIDVNKSCGISEGGPMESAAFEGHLEVVKLLVQNGAILDVSTAAKNPLFAAIYNGHFDIVKFLVENGIDYKASYKIGSIENCDAYEYARQYGRTEIAEYLKEKMNEK